MNAIYQVLGYPLGWIMWAFYHLTNNYGLSLLLFTIFTRVVLVPFAIKQQKSSLKMTMLKPQMTELQNKYKNNKEKLNEEMMKLYQKEGYNPMSGCLPLLIQMPILFGLIDVIYRPLRHIVRLSAEVITIGEGIAQQTLGLTGAKGLNTLQLAVIKGVQQTPELYSAMGPDAIAAIQSLKLNFWGMDLTTVPSVGMFREIFSAWNPVILIPILSGLSALAMSIVTMRTSAASMDNAAGAGSMKGMMLMMPVFSTVIAFSVPAGVGLYWFYSNIIAMAQSLLLNKFYNPKEMAEKARIEYEERQERERLERIEAKKLAKEGALEDKEKALTQKEINRRKLAEARKRDAEKYGEDYVEVTDEDLK